MHLLPVNLSALSSLAAKDEGKYAMQGVRLSVDGNKYECAATDGKRLIVVSGECVEGIKDSPTEIRIPESSPIHSAPNGECVSLVPARAWKDSFARAAKLKRSKYASGERFVATVIGKAVTSFAACENGIQTFDSPTNQDGRFPPYKDVLPKRKPYASVLVDPKMLRETLQAIESFTDDYSCATTMEIHPKGIIMLIRENASGQKATALVVGLCGNDPKQSSEYHLDQIPDSVLEAELACRNTPKDFGNVDAETENVAA